MAETEDSPPVGPPLPTGSPASAGPPLPTDANPLKRRMTRRGMLAAGVGVTGLAGCGLILELMRVGDIPGQQWLARYDGACSLPTSPFSFMEPIGVTESGTFHSQARGLDVGYSIAYPSGHGPSSHLPLVVVFHGFGRSHTDSLTGLSLAQAASLKVNGTPLPPMAFVAADLGNLYLTPHGDDDPMTMVVDELVPMCQARGLGLGEANPVMAFGTSMGGYGALLMAEKYPHLVQAVAAISPAIWTSYDQAHAADSGAYESAASFSTNDVVTHAVALAGKAVRVASGASDPFRPGAEAFVKAMPTPVTEAFVKGCHDGAFFHDQEAPSISFLGEHLAGR